MNDLLKRRQRQVGRPSKFTQKLATKIYWFAKKGFTDEEICYAVDISVATLNSWKKSQTFAKALKKHKETVDVQVEQGMLKRALGGKTKDVVTRQVGTPSDKDGDVIIPKQVERTVVEKEILPDVQAGKFWLTNRQPERWKEKGINIGIDAKILSVNMSDEQIAKELREHYEREADTLARLVRETLGFKMEAGSTDLPE